jgi:hypothetical protein
MYKKIYRAKATMPHKFGCVECGIDNDERSDVGCEFCDRMAEKVVSRFGFLSEKIARKILNHLCETSGDGKKHFIPYTLAFVAFTVSKVQTFSWQKEIWTPPVVSMNGIAFEAYDLKFDAEVYKDTGPSICVRCAIKYIENDKWKLVGMLSEYRESGIVDKSIRERILDFAAFKSVYL